MSEMPPEPASGTPADRAAGSMPEDQYLGRDSGADLEADGGADGGADSGADGGADGGADSGADGGADSGAGADDPTTEVDEDPRFA